MLGIQKKTVSPSAFQEIQNKELTMKLLKLEQYAALQLLFLPNPFHQ